MNLLNIILMNPPADGESASIWPMLLMMAAVFYFFMILPQQRRKKKMNAFKEEVEKGSKIITTGGIHGKIVSVEEDTFIIETEGHGRLKIQKSAISLELTQALNKVVEEKEKA